MKNELILVVIMIGHVLGDFYFQSKAQVEEKVKEYSAVLYHGLCYSVWILVPYLFCVATHTFESSAFALAICILHLAIDSIKFCFQNFGIIKDKKPFKWIKKHKWLKDISWHSEQSWMKSHIFILDQTAHLISLLLCWYFWGAKFEVNQYLTKGIQFLPYLPITVILGVLCLLKPTSILITKTVLANIKKTKVSDASFNIQASGASVEIQPSDTKSMQFSNAVINIQVPKTSEGKPNDAQQDDSQSKPDRLAAGEIIGYMERLIVFFLLMYNEFSAIAFVLTAKSLVRFTDREDGRATAEYYLVGTLASVAVTFIITILLGLCIKSVK